MIDGSVVITGADQPVGEAIARRVSSEVEQLVLAGTDESALTATADELDGVETRYLRSDPRDEFDIERLIETAKRESSDGIGLVIPAARVGHTDVDDGVRDISYAALDDEMRTNIRGVFSTIREAEAHASAGTKILIPVSLTDESSATYGACEHAITRLSDRLAVTTSLSLATVDIGDLVSDGDVDASAASERILDAALRDIGEYDGRMF